MAVWGWDTWSTTIKAAKSKGSRPCDIKKDKFSKLKHSDHSDISFAQVLDERPLVTHRVDEREMFGAQSWATFWRSRSFVRRYILHEAVAKRRASVAVPPESLLTEEQHRFDHGWCFSLSRLLAQTFHREGEWLEPQVAHAFCQSSQNSKHHWNFRQTSTAWQPLKIGWALPKSLQIYQLSLRNLPRQWRRVLASLIIAAWKGLPDKLRSIDGY